MIHHVPFRAMGSMCEVVLAAHTEAQAQLLAQPAIDEVHRVECKYSRYRHDSVVSLINASAGDTPVLCDEETWALLNFADQLHRQSNGFFDITSGVLRQGWDFAVPKIPSAAELERLCALVDWCAVERQTQHIYLPRRGMEIDFGGFGKEYAADRAAQMLKQQGVLHGYVNLAGDMRFVGSKPSGEPWMIGIQDPRKHTAVAATLSLVQGGLATSGDYERYFEIEGNRYCHMLNPFNGMPVQHWRTVSVTAPMAVMAGCTSTVAMLMQAKGLAFLESSGFNYFAIDHQGHVYTKT